MSNVGHTPFPRRNMPNPVVVRTTPLPRCRGPPSHFIPQCKGPAVVRGNRSSDRRRAAIAFCSSGYPVPHRPRYPMPPSIRSGHRSWSCSEQAQIAQDANEAKEFSTMLRNGCPPYAIYLSAPFSCRVVGRNEFVCDFARLATTGGIAVKIRLAMISTLSSCSARFVYPRSSFIAL